MTRKIEIAAKNGDYTVTVGENLPLTEMFSELLSGGKELSKGKVAIVSDDNVFPLYGDKVAAALQGTGAQVCIYVLPHGEASKMLGNIGVLLGFLADQGLDRGDTLVALGGGVISDMTGFAAAVYMRGIGYITLPTTLLAAVDASVGGKTGVDLPAGKNLAGAFYPPRAVLCDVTAFDTLPDALLADGFAEVIKHAFIADKELYELLRQDGSDGTRFTDERMVDIVYRNVRVKADVVTEDEREHGRRRVLNFGHTVGHAIETLSGYTISHGSAVAMGMAKMCEAADRRGLTVEPMAPRMREMLTQYRLPVECPYGAAALAGAIAHDKKRQGEEVAFVVCPEIGQAEIVPVKLDEVAAFLGD